MPLNILHPFQLAVQSTTTISELKEMVRIQVGISPARQSLFFSGDELAGDATLRDLGVPIDSTLILTVGDPIPASSSGGHGLGGQFYGIHYNRVQHNSAVNAYGCNSLQQYSAANASGFNSLNNMAASSYGAYNLQFQQPNAYYSHDQSMLNNWQPSPNHLSAADPTLPESIDLYIFRAGTLHLMTNIVVKPSETVYNVKKQIEQILGHDICRQQLNDGENILHDDTLIQDIPKLIESNVVFLSLV